MPIEFRPEFHTTEQIIERLRTLDREHPAIRPRELMALVPPDELRFLQFGVEDSVKNTVEKMPVSPTMAQAQRALGSVVRTVDHGGRLHATLTHALGISRPASLLKPFPALPDRNPPAIPASDFPAVVFPPIRSRRELVVVLHTHDAVGRALDEFQTGVASMPYRLERNPFDEEDRPQAIRFIGDLLGRADVLDILARAKSQLVELRAQGEALQTEFDDTTPIAIDSEQTLILNEVARGFVTDLVRSTQAVLRQCQLPAERTSVLHQHVDTVMQEIAPSREPLRFATSWVTDEHYPRAHRFIGELPSFRHDDLQRHETYARYFDYSLLQNLQQAEHHAAEFATQALRPELPRALTHPSWAATPPRPQLPERALLNALRGVAPEQGASSRNGSLECNPQTERAA